MSESPRAWYQNGWTMSFFVFVLLPLAYVLYQGWERSQKPEVPEVIPMFSVVVRTPLFGTSYLDLNVWHQHTRDLRNGRLEVYTVHPNAKGKNDELNEREFYSFERWKPNKDNAVNLTLPLHEYQAGTKTRFGVLLLSRHTTGSWREYALVDGELELVHDVIGEYRRRVQKLRR